MKTWSAWLTFALVACNGAGQSEEDDGPGTRSTECDDEGPADDGTDDDGPADDGPGDSSGDSGDATATSATDPSADDGEASSTTDTPAQCGDGTCDADESTASCCADCGCADGSSCVEDACMPDPFCGDGACNGAETQDECCGDCGCQDGSACEAGTCVVQPYCGDGSCNGGETQDDCCTDCGCGTDYGCEDNACVCTNAFLHFENVMLDADQYCFATNSFYTQESTAYFNDGSQWIYLPDGGFADYPGDIGYVLDGTQQCCLIDPCVGSQVCPTPLGNFPCICAAPTPLSGTINTCVENFVALCG